MKVFAAPALVLVALLLTTACAPTATPTPKPTLAPTLVSGAELYSRLGCAACHSSEGWGTRTGSPLAGVSQDEVKAAVRNPKAPMPRFGPEVLSDADLDVLAPYISSFQPPALAAGLKAHLGEALEAAEDRKKESTELHLRKAIEVVPPQLKGALEFVLEEAEEGELEETEDFIGMLLGKASPQSAAPGSPAASGAPSPPATAAGTPAPPVTMSPPAASAPISLPAQEDSRGGLTVVVEGALRPGQPLELKVSLDTHSGSLNFDLTPLAVLEDSQGNRYTPTVWKGSPAGGHHREGSLFFPPIQGKPEWLRLIVRDLYGVPQRAFIWQIPL